MIPVAGSFVTEDYILFLREREENPFVENLLLIKRVHAAKGGGDRGAGVDGVSWR